MKNKIKCILTVLLLFWFVNTPASPYSYNSYELAPFYNKYKEAGQPYNCYVLTDNTCIEQAGNIAWFYSELDNAYNYLEFNSEKNAYDFIMHLGNLCYKLNRTDTLINPSTNKPNVEYVYSTVIIRRLEYVIAYYNPLIRYPESPDNIQENYYNKQFYRKSTATGENFYLKVSSNINQLLYTIMDKGMFNDELLNKYNIPIPENSGRKDELGYDIIIKPKT